MENYLEGNAMNELFGRIKHVNQNVPRGITKVLDILSNPRIIDWTEEWLNEEYSKIEEKKKEECENCYPGCGGECDGVS